MYYKEYFSSKEKYIREKLNQWKSENKKVAIWGAGHKGNEFLQIFDSNNEFIKAVFDKDNKKYGNVLKTGHRVEDYRNFIVDIIILFMPSFELETRLLLYKSNFKGKIYSLDNIIFGNLLTEDNDKNNVNNLKSVRKTKIAALVIVYNPWKEVQEYIKSYALKCDEVYIYDNSAKSNEALFSQIVKDSSVRYIYGNGENRGIGYPINKIAEIAMNNDCEWLITFDQDSIASPDMIQIMRQYVESDSFDEKVAMIVPSVNETENYNSVYDSKFIAQLPHITYTMQGIQSGAMNRLDALKDVGGYNEKMFIDVVDYEYSARVRASGYRIAKVNRAILYHNIDDNDKVMKQAEGFSFYVKKYTASRYYSTYRNMLYCADKYHDIDPIFSENCRRLLKIFDTRVKYDENYSENKQAIEKAKKDVVLLFSD